MDDERLIPLSAIQHWAYCPRQCALIHLDQAFDDNIHTMRGHAVHAQVDRPGMELRQGLRVERALPLWNEQHGLIGKADAVEFDSDGTPYPVEYKHGSRHKAAGIAACDDLQLVGQALCLEEMTGKQVPEGALFYATSKRRRVVPISAALRQQVIDTASQVRRMLATATMPKPYTGDFAVQRCKGCSLRDRCQPEVVASTVMENLAADLFNPDV